MRKLYVDQDKCVSCGACIVECALLQEDNEGKALPVNGGVITSENESSVMNTVGNCPVNALLIKDESRSFEQIKDDLNKPLEIPEVPQSTYQFNKENYYLPIIPGCGEYQYNYSSDEKAEREGLRDFRDNIYSQKKTIAQQVIASYKQEKLVPLMKYEEQAGNYLFETNKQLEEKLRSYVAEIEACLGKKFNKSQDFFRFATRHNKVIGWSTDYLDEGLANSVANACESYDWFDCYVNSDDMIVGTKSHWYSDYDEDVYKYCYKLDEASAKLNQQILDECQNIVPERAKKQVESAMQFYYQDLEKEWNEKIKKIVEVNNYVSVNDVRMKNDMENSSIKSSVDENKPVYDEYGWDQRGFNKYGVNRNGTMFDNDGLDIHGYDKDGYDSKGMDKDGYNRKGFNLEGFSRDGSRYDKDGYDFKGYNVNGFNREGYNSDGYNIDGYDVNGFNQEGYDKYGYDKDGFDKQGVDKEGYDRKGFNKQGMDRDGYDVNGFDADGWNREGFNEEGYNKEGFDLKGHNRAGYDKDGYDIDGYSKNGYDRSGFDRNGYSRAGYDKDGYDKEGYNKGGFNRDGYDKNGYNRVGFNREGYDREGYNRGGFNDDGYDRDGFDIAGYNEEGYNREGYDASGYDKEGFDKEGFDSAGYDRFGYGKDGYDCSGYNKKCFDRSGINVNGTRYDKNGYDCNGFDVNGYDENGYDREGYNKAGYSKNGYDKNGYDREGYDKNGFNRSGFDRNGWNTQRRTRRECLREAFAQVYLELIKKYGRAPIWDVPRKSFRGNRLRMEEKDIDPQIIYESLENICQGKYLTGDILYLRLSMDSKDGWALTMDSFCYMVKEKKGILMYKDIESIDDKPGEINIYCDNNECVTFSYPNTVNYVEDLFGPSVCMQLAGFLTKAKKIYYVHK